jgi:hypothetical protein
VVQHGRGQTSLKLISTAASRWTDQNASEQNCCSIALPHQCIALPENSMQSAQTVEQREQQQQILSHLRQGFSGG